MPAVPPDSVAPEAAPGNVSSEAMSFVQDLAAQVSERTIELPSYPKAAMRVQRALADRNSDISKVVSVIGGEAVLAARVIKMANSAALNTSGTPVTDLRLAVQRIGFDWLRSACYSFAMGQLRRAGEYRAIQGQMATLWRESMGAAAGASVLARRLHRSAPDTAMLAGLMSGVGKLYILAHGQRYPALFGDPASYEAVVRDWHSGVARSILENWGMVEEVVDAVATLEESRSDERARVTLADLVACGDLLAQCADSPDQLLARLPEDCAARRLGITAENSRDLAAEVVAELRALTQAMG
jgi:HD-like signal output (HDOD) protein